MKRALISAAMAAAVVTLPASSAWASPASSTIMPGRTAYTVAPGDSFWSVGQRFAVNMYDLAAWNHMDLQAPLDYGWTLQIPPAGWHAASAAAQPAANRTATDSGSSYHRSSATNAGSYSGGQAAVSSEWQCIAEAESGSNPAANTGNGYYGEFQFSQATWNAIMSQMGLSYSRADLAPASVQYAAAQHLQSEAGWGQWPVTSRACGLG